MCWLLSVVLDDALIPQKRFSLAFRSLRLGVWSARCRALSPSDCSSLHRLILIGIWRRDDSDREGARWVSLTPFSCGLRSAGTESCVGLHPNNGGVWSLACGVWLQSRPFVGTCWSLRTPPWRSRTLLSRPVSRSPRHDLRFRRCANWGCWSVMRRSVLSMFMTGIPTSQSQSPRRRRGRGGSVRGASVNVNATGPSRQMSRVTVTRSHGMSHVQVTPKSHTPLREEKRRKGKTPLNPPRGDDGEIKRNSRGRSTNGLLWSSPTCHPRTQQVSCGLPLAPDIERESGSGSTCCSGRPLRALRDL
jgi:hypothetical protein